jgi:outer membrane protein TolC
MRLSFVLTALAASLPATAQSALVVDEAYLAALRLEVGTNHPTAAAAQARAAAAAAAVRAVRLWEDPMAGFGVMAAEREMRREDGDLMFSAEQMLPRRKLYDARKARAVAERSVLEAESRSAVLGLETVTAQAALELALMDEMLAIETNQLVWLETMARTARELLKDPMASASEALRIESELAQQRQKIDSTSRQRLRLVRQLNILLGRDAEQPWPLLRLPAAAPSTPALAEQLDRLFPANPMVHALLNTADAARAEMEVARRERTPAFSVGVESSVYSGGDFRQATVGAKMTLPWFNRSAYRAMVDGAHQQRLAAEREVEALHRRLRAEAIAAHTEAENAGRQAATFSTEVIPRAEKAADSTQNAWVSSKANVLELFEAWRGLFEARIEERRWVASQRAALETLRSIIPPETNP